MEEIVKEFYIGETSVCISDKCCREVTAQEAEQILSAIAAKSIGYIQKK